MGTNLPPRVIPPGQDPRPQLPPDVQGRIKDFQNDRKALMRQLQRATAEERRQILGQLEEQRAAHMERMKQMRDDAKQQAEDMRERFGNAHDHILNMGAPTAPPAVPGGGKPRE